MERFLVINIIPVAWQRPRVSKQGGFYTAGKVSEYKRAIQLAWNDKYGDAPVMDGPIRMTVMFVLPRPKAMMWKTKPTPSIFHTKRPDLDNLEKGVMDALQGLAFRDDSQICSKVATKYIAGKDDQPMIQIWMQEVE